MMLRMPTRMNFVTRNETNEAGNGDASPLLSSRPRPTQEINRGGGIHDKCIPECGGDGFRPPIGCSKLSRPSPEYIASVPRSKARDLIDCSLSLKWLAILQRMAQSHCRI